MFSFHKPKIYRSLNGCCICRAKSSSSRFTDSKRYEGDFTKCFKILEKRSGEICNACVLLVKRWKKLPSGSNRNWHHVVDARAGPGTKSIMKIKSKSKEEKMKKKHKHKKRLRINKPPQSPGGLSDDVLVGDDCQSDHSSHRSSSPLPSDLSDEEDHVMHRDNGGRSTRRRRPSKTKPTRFSSFLDLNYWKKTEICCGIIFKGLNGEVMVDTSLLKPCASCKPRSSLASQLALPPQEVIPLERQDSLESQYSSSNSMAYQDMAAAALDLTLTGSKSSGDQINIEMEM